MEWQWLKDWWRLKRWRKEKKEQNDDDICYCDDCLPDVRYVKQINSLYEVLKLIC